MFRRLTLAVRRFVSGFSTTFRGRLALHFVIIEGAILVCSGLIVYVLLSGEVYRSLDESLEHDNTVLVNDLETLPFPYWLERISQFASNYHGSVYMVGANGMLLFSSDSRLTGRAGSEISSVLLQLAMDGKAAFISTSSLLSRGNHRMLAMPVHRAGRVVAAVVLSRDLVEIQKIMKLMYLVGSVLGFISMFLSAYAGYLMAARALSPLREITVTARAVANGNLSLRLQSTPKDREIASLVRSLNRMFAELDSSFAAQKRFTADASHELRIPLTVLKGEIEVALRRQRSVEEYAQLLRQQLPTIERMQRIVNDLLMLAKADAGILEMAHDRVDFTLLMEEVVQSHIALFSSRLVEINCDISEELWLRGDPDRLSQLFYNLLNNAFKYSPDNNAIEFTAHGAEGEIIVSVCDHGPGISLEDQNRIFDRFYRVDDSRARDQGGAGLGLTICKRIVEGHGGWITLQSTVGQGSCFIVHLPTLGGAPLQRPLDV